MAGVDAGYFLLPRLSVGVELHDQTFLSTPTAVASGKTLRTRVIAGGAVRAHVPLGAHAWFRPGPAFVQPLNDPSQTISAASYHIVELDLPVTF